MGLVQPAAKLTELEVARKQISEIRDEQAGLFQLLRAHQRAVDTLETRVNEIIAEVKGKTNTIPAVNVPASPLKICASEPNNRVGTVSAGTNEQRPPPSTTVKGRPSIKSLTLSNMSESTDKFSVSEATTQKSTPSVQCSQRSFDSLKLAMMNSVCQANNSAKLCVTVRMGLLGKYSLQPGSHEDPIAVLQVEDQGIRWCVAKDSVQLRDLDSVLRSECDYKGLNLPNLPQDSSLTSANPVKVDVRIDVLNAYFKRVFEYKGMLGKQAAAAVATFCSTNIIELNNQTFCGFLSSMSTRSNAWKAKFYVRSGDFLQVLDCPGGQILEVISLSNATIYPVADDFNDHRNDQRNGFVITESRAGSTKTKAYSLCAESQDSRTKWVDHLRSAERFPQVASTTIMPFWLTDTPDLPLGTTGKPLIVKAAASDSDAPSPPQTARLDRFPSGTFESSNERQALEKEKLMSTVVEHRTTCVSPPTSPKIVRSNSESRSRIERHDTAGQEGQRVPEGTNRNTIHFSGVKSPDAQLSRHSSARMSQRGWNDLGSTSGRHVFGVPIKDALEFSSTAYDGAVLPTVVAHCLYQLNYRRAAGEQGIFRLSGVQSKIDDLELAYEHDEIKSPTQLVSDINSIANLLKRYFRRLPVPLFSCEEAVWFDKTGKDHIQKVWNLREMVHGVEECRFQLLRAVVKFLVTVHQKERVNKMSLRNLGIVLSPALQIPAGLLGMLVEEYDVIFESLSCPV